MSWNARRFRTSHRRQCDCGQPALHSKPRSGGLVWRREYPLCGRCMRSVIDGTRLDRTAGSVTVLITPQTDQREVA